MSPQTVVLPVKPPRQITGRMVLIGFILFFGVISVVNGIFMYMALHTWPGLTNTQAYKDGIKYNEVLADGERQAALGWQSRVKMSDGLLLIDVTAKDGTPMTGLALDAVISRPLGSEERVTLRATEVTPGKYQASLVSPVAGRWMIDVTAQSPDATKYRMRHEVLVTP
tara:strand:- start:6537 stop:7040 length:504 start_codon:yes stop_codon:yes gene_type:complete